jgi:predicted RNA-binding protein with PIN domain
MIRKNLLIVDGYNMIASWESTRQMFQKSELEEARDLLLQKLSDYANFEGIEVICVFDAQFVPGVRSKFTKYNVIVIFTKEDETADSYIERLAGKCNDAVTTVSVATSDLAEQWVIFSQGALRVPARELEEKVAIGKKNLKTFTKVQTQDTPRNIAWSPQDLQHLQALLFDGE